MHGENHLTHTHTHTHNLIKATLIIITRSVVASFGGWKIVLKSSCHIFRVLCACTNIIERSLEAIELQ